MVKLGLPVFLRFGLTVKNSAFRFSYNSAFRIWPNGPVRFSLLLKLTFIVNRFGHICGILVTKLPTLFGKQMGKVTPENTKKIDQIVKKIKPNVNFISFQLFLLIVQNI